MLTKPSLDVQDCLQLAAECELQAKLATDPNAKSFFLDMAARCRRAAATFDHTKRVGRFLKSGLAHQATR